jgi:signal transduction histidine kinase
MMHDFLSNNHDDLIARCAEKVARRPKRAATKQQLENGIPMFLEQLTRTLEAEQGGEVGAGTKISGASGGDAQRLSEMGVSAAAHGTELLKLGYTVDQVVHDYGDLCQAVTDLAFERDAPFSIDEFRTLNRCLDNAIADAVTEFSAQRDSTIAARQSSDLNERVGFLMHELRNSLGTAVLAVDALEAANLTMAGATGAVLKRSLAALGALIDRSIVEVRVTAGVPLQYERFSLAAFIADAQAVAALDAKARGSELVVSDVDPLLTLNGDRELLLAALGNLLSNALKFTHSHTDITLNAYARGDRIIIEVEDHCGGLSPGDPEKMFSPFTQRSADRTGLGLGLPIARQSVEANGGTLNVQDRPGVGCIFTISLPRPAMSA